MRLPVGVSISLAAAVWLSATSALADGVLPDSATPVQREQAQSRFLRGKELRLKGNCEGALVEFRASHAIVSSPNTRLEVARCLLTSGKTVAAYAEFGRAAVEAKELIAQDNRYDRAYRAAVAERGEIESRLAFVTLRIENATEETRVLVGGEEILRAAWAEPAPIPAQLAEIVVETPGHARVVRKIQLAAGQRSALTIDAQSVAEPPEGSSSTEAALVPLSAAPPASASWMRAGAYVAGGVGAAGLAAFAVFGLMAHSTYDDLAHACPGGACSADKSGEVASGKTSQTLANIGLVAGVVGVAAGATLFVLSLRKTPDSSAAFIVTPSWAGVRGTL